MSEQNNSNEADLRSQIKAMMDTDRTLTGARISKESGVSATAFSRWRAGTYEGDNEAVEAKLQRWIDTIQSQAQAQRAMPEPPAFVDTPTSARVIDALRYAQVAGDIAVVYGGAGLGKTTSINRYSETASNVFHATMSPASASVVTALEEVAEAVGASGAVGGAAKLHRAICRKLAGSQGLLVIDESQHLSVAALDQIRSIHDATGIGIALVGNEQVYARMTGGNRAAYLDRLYSRIGKRVRLVRATKDDINSLIKAWGIEDGKCRQQLVDIASKPGGLRGLTKVLRLAAMFAAAQERPLCCDDVRAAWRELGGAE